MAQTPSGAAASCAVLRDLCMAETTAECDREHLRSAWRSETRQGAALQWPRHRPVIRDPIEAQHWPEIRTVVRMLLLCVPFCCTMPGSSCMPHISIGQKFPAGFDSIHVRVRDRRTCHVDRCRGEYDPKAFGPSSPPNDRYAGCDRSRLGCLRASEFASEVRWRYGGSANVPR